MEWTDERMDDLANRMETGFAAGREETRELRASIRDLRTELKGDIKDLRTELKGDIGDLRTELKGDIGELRTMIFRFGIAFVICLLGIVVTNTL